MPRSVLQTNEQTTKLVSDTSPQLMIWMTTYPCYTVCHVLIPSALLHAPLSYHKSTMLQLNETDIARLISSDTHNQSICRNIPQTMMSKPNYRSWVTSSVKNSCITTTDSWGRQRIRLRQGTNTELRGTPWLMSSGVAMRNMPMTQ